MLDIVARVCRERGATLIVGAGSNDTASTARELRDLAAWPEVSAALTVVPYYTRPSEDGRDRALHQAGRGQPGPADRLQHPLPHRPGPERARRCCELASVPGIAGVKHAVGAVDQDTVVLMAGPRRTTSRCSRATTCSRHRCSRSAPRAASSPPRTCAPREFADLIAAWHSGPAGAGPRAWTPARPAVGGAVRRAQPGRRQGRAARPGPDPEPGGAAAAAARQ